MSRFNWLNVALYCALVLGLLVVVLGAYTRLVDAGLGCPDWPGCYGFATVPIDSEELALAAERYPNTPVETFKAWVEMAHRYFATLLGLTIVVVQVIAIRQKRPLKLPLILTGLVVAQGIFGAWTVTLKLWPQIVTLHLLGGFATVALIWWYVHQVTGISPPRGVPGTARTAAPVVLIVMVLQIALGGWTSANYAALACPDFPLCHKSWIPEMDLMRGFDIFQAIGPNYLGGELSNEARIAIQFVHRMGALTLLCGMSWLLILLRGRARWLIALLLVSQLTLGILNVVLELPLIIAVAHNFVALLLLLSVVSVLASLSTCSSAG